ncbi:hypothetical protein H310_11918 [Aphanomyces invadans]|uniref:Centrosomal protein of 162 kDa n=1 Tax=Aphanomyces invadans TaxID=157072 RepID=A0A024TJA9_9STRA|nr:hypothetical protein H310_11918 [Aphanomyces invadans]ETV94240.1 hypothetical protein H310_11918 [Aphanomyces invadans]|eukprot:XP_008877002.1 hypothetical protein H310_11918 [Aphanomyces invadans]
MSSDEEFEKFLQGDSDDEQSAFTKTKKKASKKKTSTAKGSSSKPKGKPAAKPAAPTLALDDSADPYNFDMAPSALSRSSDDDDDFEVKKEAQKKAKQDNVPPPKKLSLEDRMADILKRHGSSLAETFAKPKEVEIVVPPPPENPPAKDDNGEADTASDKAQSSSSDSLGMESADFEVGGYAKKVPPARVETKEAPVVRAIAQPAPATIVHKIGDDDSTGYDDEDLDSVTTAPTPAVTMAPSATPSATSSAPVLSLSFTPAPFKSEFEKMKKLFAMPVENRYDENEESHDVYQDDAFEGDPSPDAVPPLAVPAPAQEDPLDKYDDDEFEDSDGPPPSPPPSPPPAAPLSPGPPPPPDSTFPGASMLLDEPKNRESAVEITMAPTPPKQGLPSFLDESFEFKYDLRTKVETNLAPPDDDEPPPPPPPPQQQQQNTTDASSNHAMAQVVQEPKSNVPSTTTDPVSTSMHVAQQLEATPLTEPHPLVNPTARQPAAAPSPISPPHDSVVLSQSSALHPPSIHRDGSDSKVNAIAAKFHALQDQLNRSTLGPPATVAGSIDTSLAQAFERDKYILRAFSTKENEMKLQLQAAEREILSLRHQVEALATEQQVHTLSDARLLGKYVQPSGGVHMTDQAWEAMRKDIESQEALIQGYQVENERLMHQLREVRRDLQYDVHLNNQQLVATIKDLRHQLETSTHSSTAAASSHQLAAQLRADAQILALEEELHQARKDHARRERELKFELDQVKKAKVDLECRVGGVHMDTLHKENEAYDALKQQLNAKLDEAHAQIESLQAKVEWYVQNQRFIDGQDELVKQLRSTIAALQEQLADKNSRPSAVKSKKPAARTSSTADKRRIQALEAQLKEMHTAMRKRHPDSLVNLILASKPTADEIQAKEQHDQQLQQLRDQLAEMEKQHEVKLTKFRQQHERVVQQLRDEAVAKVPAADNSSDVAKVRLYYQTKIKDLERKLEAKATKVESFSKSGQRAPCAAEPSSTTLDDLEQRYREREVSLQRQLDESENARRQLIAVFNSTAPPASPAPQQETPAPTAVQTARIVELEARNAHLEADLAQVQTAMAALSEAHKVNLQQTKDMWQEELLHLSEKLSNAQAECHRFAQVAAQVPVLEEHVQALQAKLDIPNTPSMLQYQALEMQIHTLTQKYAIRETELQVLLQHATHSSQVEIMLMQQRHERAMALKCAEIATFQGQLDEMLEELRRLQQHP